MLPNIFIILGIIIIICCVISYIKSPQIIIVHNSDDAKNASNNEKDTGKVKRFGMIICFIIAIIFLIIGFVIQYASRGNDTFLSEDIEGINTGNDDMQYQQKQGVHITGNIMNLSDYEYSYSVVVSEKMISLNNQQIGGIDQFEEYLKELDRQQKVLLVDDFAVSATFHKVQELLDAYGMKYEMESDE